MAGMLNQPQAIQEAAAPVVVPLEPRTLPNFPTPIYSFVQDQPSYGASRFLMGELPGLSFNFDVPAVTYKPFGFAPGDFESFKAGLDFSDSKNPVIPAFDPATGRYKAPATTRRSSGIAGVFSRAFGD